MNKAASGRTQEESSFSGRSSGGHSSGGGEFSNSTATDRLGSRAGTVDSEGAIQVRRTKFCFALIVLACGIAVSSVIYYFIVKGDYDQFNVEVRATITCCPSFECTESHYSIL